MKEQILFQKLHQIYTSEMTHIIRVMNHFIQSLEKPLSVQREESESKKRRASGTLMSQSSKKRKTDS